MKGYCFGYSKTFGLNEIPEAYCIPCRLYRFESLVRQECGKSFLQPQVIPPFHGYQVPKPLVTHEIIEMVMICNSIKLSNV